MTGTALVVHRVVRAPVDRVWAAWTTAELMQRWWGPDGVECVGVEIDLRVGGEYRIGNRTPDGSTVWIEGTYEVVEPRRRLVYSWRTAATQAAERVSVHFESEGPGTRLRIVHERIPDEPTRVQHGVGWRGCLDGLERHLGQA